MKHTTLFSTLLLCAGIGATAKEAFLGHNTWLGESNVTTTPAPHPVTIGPPSTQPVPMPTINPGEVALPVHLTVIIIISLLVAILFIAIYVQLILVIRFGYKLISYQTALLFNILLWAALRLTLYSFYYYHCCESVRLLTGGVGWVLVAFPAVLQYLSLAILVRYFGESLFKVFERRQEMATLAPPYRKMSMYRVLGNAVWFASVFIFLAGNIAFYVAIGMGGYTDSMLLPTFRVLLLDGLFLVMAVTLGVCIVLIYTTRVGKDVLEAQRVHKCWPLLMSILLVALFLSRAIYNIVAVRISDIHVFGDGSTFATDMADNEFYSSQGENKYGYVAYFAVLVIWEIIPTYLIVIFFRVKIPSRSSAPLGTTSSLTLVNISQLTQDPPEDIGSARGRHFFENPHRYDEADHLFNGTSRNSTGQVSIPSMHSLPPGGYGSITSRQNVTNKYSINNTSSATSHSYMPGTTPPQLFTSPSFFRER